MMTKHIPNLIRALRPKQWTKNSIVFAAFFFALGDQQQRIGIDSFWKALSTCLLFCLLSSTVYLINDIRDIPLDREHPKKKKRPIAAGLVSIPVACATACCLGLLSIVGSLFISTNVTQVFAAYLLLQICYSLFLKHIALVDLFVIAAGFVLRALAGAVAVQAEISPWLLLCTLLLALFLALCKRRHEKVILSDLGTETRTSLGNYDEKLLDQLIAIVSAATVVSYSLYTLWPDTIAKFGTSLLGFTIPFVIFGIFRYLDLVYRHEKGDRPEQILLTDVPLIIDIILYGATVFVIAFLI